MVLPSPQHCRTGVLSLKRASQVTSSFLLITRPTSVYILLLVMDLGQPNIVIYFAELTIYAILKFKCGWCDVIFIALLIIVYIYHRYRPMQHHNKSFDCVTALGCCCVLVVVQRSFKQFLWNESPGWIHNFDFNAYFEGLSCYHILW